MTGSDTPPFRLAYVPGVTPDKWVRTWNERFHDVDLTLIPVPDAKATAMVRDRNADAAILRLPIDRTGLHAIPLYTEATVVVVPKDHLVTAAASVSTSDLADDVLLHPRDDTLDWERPPGKPAIERPDTTGNAIELVAAGVGLLIVPQSLARLYHRKDLTYVSLSDAPQSSVALSWLEDETTDLMERFIGIVRGRTVNSTRGRQPAPTRRNRADGGQRRSSGTESTDKARKRAPGDPQRGKRRTPRRRS